LLFALCTSLQAQTLRVSESDGTPTFNGITELVFPPGSVVINGRQARIGTGGGGGVPGSGISSLNGMIGATQTFSRTNDTNVLLTIASAANNHSFTLSWSGALGKSRQHAATVYTDQANTFGAFLQKFQAGNNFNLVDPSDTTRAAKFDVSNIATATTRSINIPNADSTTVQPDTGTSNNFLTAVSAQGLISKARPTCANLSDSAASCATDATNATNITSGTLPDGRFPATLPAASGINLTALNASNLGSGTVADARLSANVPLINAANAFSNSGNNTFAGKVGIGTTSPGHKLNIHDAAGNYFAATLTSALIGTAGNWVGINFGFTDSGAGYQKGAIIFEGQDANGRGKMYFAMNGAASSASAAVADARMTIDYAGLVGVGTTSPGRELEVNGGLRLNTATAKPTCNSSNRGTFWVVNGGAGVKDTVEVCAKDAGDAYAWRTIY